MIKYAHPVVEHSQAIPYILTKRQHTLLMPVGDVHFMSKGWPKKKFIDHLKWGMDRGATFLGMGEYIDFASPAQRSILRALRDTTKEQLAGMLDGRVLEFYEMIAFTKGHWIGLLEGDHYGEYVDGTTTDQYLCRLLDIPFLGTSAHLRLLLPDLDETADCLLYIHHGIGSARTSGGHLHRVEDLLRWIDADIYLMGHTHAKVSNPLDRQHVTRTGTHYHRTKLIARTGGFLRGYCSSGPLGLREPAFLSRGAYVEKMAYTPTAMGGLCIGVGVERVENETHRPTIHYSV